MATAKMLITAEQLLHMPSAGKRLELVKGELIEMPPAGGRHGKIASKIDRLLGTFVEKTNAGETFAAETGFRLAHDPDTVRAADVAFISKARLPQGDLPDGFWGIVPDLVVEVMSPSDTAPQVQAKVEDWLSAGVRLVWVVYPNTRSVVVYNAQREARVLATNETLTGEPVLPGFTCKVSELF
jgi:Uma2 family endonuclease